MHLRIRVVVSKEIKERVYEEAVRRKEARTRKMEEVVRSSESEDEANFNDGMMRERAYSHIHRPKVSPSLQQRRATRAGAGERKPPSGSLERDRDRGGSKKLNASGTDSEDIERAEDEIDDLVLRAESERGVSSILYDPGRATSVQRRWLKTMSADKDKSAAYFFDKWVLSCRLCLEMRSLKGMLG